MDFVIKTGTNGPYNRHTERRQNLPEHGRAAARCCGAAAGGFGAAAGGFGAAAEAAAASALLLEEASALLLDAVALAPLEARASPGTRSSPGRRQRAPSLPVAQGILCS
jgi:hypothetical protein